MPIPLWVRRAGATVMAAGLLANVDDYAVSPHTSGGMAPSDLRIGSWQTPVLTALSAEPVALVTTSAPNSGCGRGRGFRAAAGCR